MQCMCTGSHLQVKPGTCPMPVGVGTCVQGCTSDANCAGNAKCCSNGCGTSCQEPISMFNNLLICNFKVSIVMLVCLWYYPHVHVLTVITF